MLLSKHEQEGEDGCAADSRCGTTRALLHDDWSAKVAWHCVTRTNRMVDECDSSQTSTIRENAHHRMRVRSEEERAGAKRVANSMAGGGERNASANRIENCAR